MDRERERARLQEKLARCRDLAKQYTEGAIADMIRDMEKEITEDIQKLESE